MDQTSGAPKSRAPKTSRTKKTPTHPPISEETPDELPKPTEVDFTAIQQRVFQVRGTDIYVGGIKVPPEMRELMRDQAQYIITSQLWEVFNAAIINESSSLALIQSENWDHVQAAKMLHHWGHVFRNALYSLAKS